jgi:hypothetical protein
MMHGHEKSRLAIVAVKPANKAAPSIVEQSAEEVAAAESGEPRARAEGECAPAKHAPDSAPDKRDTSAGTLRHDKCRLDPRWEPYAGQPHVRICAGGAQQWASLPRLACFAVVQESVVGPFSPLSVSGRHVRSWSMSCRRKNRDFELPPPVALALGAEIPARKSALTEGTNNDQILSLLRFGSRSRHCGRLSRQW